MAKSNFYYIFSCCYKIALLGDIKAFYGDVIQRKIRPFLTDLEVALDQCQVSHFASSLGQYNSFDEMKGVCNRLGLPSSVC